MQLVVWILAWILDCLFMVWMRITSVSGLVFPWALEFVHALSSDYLTTKITVEEIFGYKNYEKGHVSALFLKND